MSSSTESEKALCIHSLNLFLALGTGKAFYRARYICAGCLPTIPRLTVHHITSIDYSVVENLLTRFLRDVLGKSGGRGYVVGVSGGLDSATALALATKSVGRDRVLALIMPDSRVTPGEDTEDAIALAEALGVKYHIIEISGAVDAIKRSIPIYEDDEKDRLPLGNLRARIRMCLLYYYANKLGYLVLGTSDRSEYLIGYFTKYGDGASDVAPLTLLYKTQVRAFAKHLGVPSKIADKPSAPRLWRDHVAEEELGLSYTDIDLVLAAYVDLGLRVSDIPLATGVDISVVEKVVKMVSSSEHKRRGPAVLGAELLDTVRSMVARNVGIVG